jgi:hypothetical protein
VFSSQAPVTSCASTRTVTGSVLPPETTFSLVRTAEVTSLPRMGDRSNLMSATRSALPLTGGFVSIPYWVP